MKPTLLLGGLVLLAFTAAYVLFASRSDQEPRASGAPVPMSSIVPPPPIEAGPAYTRGPSDAAIVLEEYSDYECPFCARSFLDAGAEVEAFVERRGNIRYAFFDLAGPTHYQALAASTAARCAGLQDRYPAAQRLLFQRQREWTSSDSLRADPIELVAALTVDSVAYRACVASQERVVRILDANLQQALGKGIRSTPTLRVAAYGRTQLVGGTADSTRLARILDELATPR